MAIVRCPKHDVIFDTDTDHRRPGSERMPDNCHPDCPLAGKDTTSGRKVISK